MGPGEPGRAGEVQVLPLPCPSASGVSNGLVPPGHPDRRASAGHDDDVELVAGGLHDSTRDDLGLIELPVGWELGPATCAWTTATGSCASWHSSPVLRHPRASPRS
jgi:hypothetical protein